MNSSFVWFGIPLVLGFALFHLKYKVQTGEEHLKKIHRQIVVSYDDLMVLESEWGFLNTPTRLALLNQKHTHLEPIEVKQIIHFQDLPLKEKEGEDDAV